jgi:hypothetical protein
VGVTTAVLGFIGDRLGVLGALAVQSTSARLKRLR